jgi:hypothetical protein
VFFVFSFKKTCIFATQIQAGIFMETILNQTATPESVWAILQEITRKQEETDRQMKETDRQMKETDRRMKELQKTLGGWANNHGTFAEEYFFNSFENGKQNFFGKKFDEIRKHVTNFWKGLKDEYDIVLYNDDAVAIIEVKYKAHVNDISGILKKAETFRILFPDYKDFRIYLGLASMSFYPELEQKCINEGIAIIKQVGDSVVINDKHLKVF